MCDNRNTWIYPQWNNDFYHQYMQQHARMTQWIQNMFHNLPRPWQNSSTYETHHNHYQNQQQPMMYQNHQQPMMYQNHQQPMMYQNHQQPMMYQNHQHHMMYQNQQQLMMYQNQQQPIMQQRGYIPQQAQYVRHQRHSFKDRKNSRNHYHHKAHYRSRSQTSAEYASNNEVGEQEEDDEEEGELVLNVDAILAFRALKEESEKEEDAKSEESFELVETVLNENFEFVELDSAGQMQKVFGRPTAPDTKGDGEYDRDSRIVLFGDRADRIAGLETSLEITFDHINDLHQPVVFPHV